MTYLSLGILKRSQGKFEEAETMSLKTLSIYGEALGPDDRNIGTIQSDLAGMYLYMERFFADYAEMEKEIDDIEEFIAGRR